MVKSNDTGLKYKNIPVTRKGNEIYYGNAGDKFILALKIVETEKKYNMDFAKKVKIELQDNSGNMGEGRVFRESFRGDLYQALELGGLWLKDALES